MPSAIQAAHALSMSIKFPRVSNSRQPKPQSEPDAGGVADLDKAYPAIGRDNETGRHRMHAPCAGDGTGLIVHHREIYPLFPHVARYFFRAVALHRDGDDVSMIMCDGGDGALFGAADRAPGRPEVHQHGLPGACRQRIGPARECHTLQCRRCAADDVALLPDAYARNNDHEHQHIDGIGPPFCCTRFAFGFISHV